MAELPSETAATLVSISGGETVAQLTRIWQDLLGIGMVGPDENYFDLGGDSPLAVQLFSRIEKAFKVKLPLATLFEAPTIAELARVIRCKAPASDGWSPLVAIQPSGSRAPFFCVHGAGGNVLIYRDLSRHLGSDQPFYGLQAQGLDGARPPLRKIEEMAALYVDEIRKVQPHGPYSLGGYCMGGTIAFEMAQQLQAQGEEVALLALFDTLNWYRIPLPSVWRKSYYQAQRLVFHAANFLQLDFTGKGKFLSEKVKLVWNRIPVWRGMLLWRFNRGSRGTKSKSMVLSNVWETNDRAGFDYAPNPYVGIITEFRPVKQYRMCNRPELKWDRFAQGGQEIIVLPVYPAGMLVEPFVRHLAVALRNSLDNANRKSQDARRSRGGALRAS